MKKLLSILLVALCALLPALAENDTTTITTTVPTSHTITVVCGEHGTVVVNGQRYSGTFSLDVERLGTLVLRTAPDDGYALSQVQVENLDGLTVSGRTVTLEGVYCENTITLSFYKLPVIILPSLPDTVTLPEASGTGNKLYDDYLGTGGGLSQLAIVFDEEDKPVDYELLRTPIAEDSNSILIFAHPDANDELAYRSLKLSYTQLIKLAQKQDADTLLFANGDAVVNASMEDLLGSNMQKLLGLLLHGSETITADTLDRNWDILPAVTLTVAELESITLEMRIIPVPQADDTIVYDIAVYLHWNDQELDISSMLPALSVCMTLPEPLPEDNRAIFDLLYRISYQAPDADRIFLPDVELIRLPNEPDADLPDMGEHFIVTIPEDGSTPVTTYNADAPLADIRQDAIRTAFAGQGLYQLVPQE